MGRRLTNLRNCLNNFLLIVYGEGFSTGLCYFGRQRRNFLQTGGTQWFQAKTYVESSSGLDLADFWSSKQVLERDGERAPLADIVHQGRPETRDACSGFVPNAVIDDAG